MPAKLIGPFPGSYLFLCASAASLASQYMASAVERLHKAPLHQLRQTPQRHQMSKGAKCSVSCMTGFGCEVLSPTDIDAPSAHMLANVSSPMTYSFQG